MLVELSGMIKTYMSRKNWSAAHLAKQCGLSGSTLLRVIHREQEPKLETVRAILSVITTYKEAVAFLAKYYPEFSSYLQESSEVAPEQDQNACEFFFQNIYTLQLLCMAEAGWRSSKIVSTLGPQAYHLECALDSGFVCETNGKIKVKNFSVLRASDLVKALLLMSQYQSTLKGVIPAHVTSKVLPTNAKSKKMLIERLRKVFQVAVEIESTPELQGDIPMFLGTLLGKVMTKEDLK